MAVSVIPLLLLLVFPLLVITALLAVGWHAVRSAPDLTAAAAAARRHGLVTHLAAWTVGVGGALVLFVAGVVTDRFTPALAPVCFGLLYVATCGVGELTWPSPVGPVRRATLTPRATAAPTWLSWATAGWALGLLGAFVALAVATDGGYAFLRSTPTRGTAVGPFPGWEVGVPLLVGAALLLAVTAVTLRAVAARPAVTGEPDFDRWSRRTSAHRALRGAQLALGLIVAEVLATVAAVLRRAEVDPAATALMATAVVVGIAAVVMAAIPATRPRAPIGPAPPARPRGGERDPAPTVASGSAS